MPGAYGIDPQATGLIPACHHGRSMVEDTGTWDKVKGKTNQIVGDAKGDKSQSLKGHVQEAKGDVKSGLSDKNRRV